MKGYAEFKEGDLILRDCLAYDRTRLALTRTALSIIRTSLGLFASGAGLIVLKDELGLVGIGYLLIAAAIGVIILGTVYYLQFKRRLDVLREKNEDKIPEAMR